MDASTNPAPITSFRQVAEEAEAIAQRIEQIREGVGTLLVKLDGADTTRMFTFAEMTYSLREAARAALTLAQRFDSYADQEQKQ